MTAETEARPRDHEWCVINSLAGCFSDSVVSTIPIQRRRNSPPENKGRRHFELLHNQQLTNPNRGKTAKLLKTGMFTLQCGQENGLDRGTEPTRDSSAGAQKEGQATAFFTLLGGSEAAGTNGDAQLSAKRLRAAVWLLQR